MEGLEIQMLGHHLQWQFTDIVQEQGCDPDKANHC